MSIHIRLITSADLDSARQLYYNTINQVNCKDYDADQVAVWSSGVDNLQRWQSRLNTQYFIVAEADGEIVGMTSLTPEGYLDLMYVHHNWQGKGVASLLLTHLENQARLQGAYTITTDASITAKPFFEKRGYSMMAQQTVNVKGINLTNFKMAKVLTAST